MEASVKKMKRHATDPQIGRKYISGKRFVSEVYKILFKKF